MGVGKWSPHLDFGKTRAGKAVLRKYMRTAVTMRPDVDDESGVLPLDDIDRLFRRLLFTCPSKSYAPTAIVQKRGLGRGRSELRLSS